MREYSPKRRTAVVFAGSGISGAYHAGALKALDESGVKIDLVAGSGAGVIAAGFAAVAAGSKLYGPLGFWDGIRWSALYRLRLSARIALALFLLAFVLFLVPLLLALLVGLLAIPVLLIDLVVKGLLDRLVDAVATLPQRLRSFYTAALSIPSFSAALLALAVALRAFIARRRRAAELFEALLDVKPLRRRLLGRLWEVVRMAAISESPAADREIAKRYLALLGENLDQPGFRELILRASDLDTGQALVAVFLRESARNVLQGLLGRSRHSSVVDLKAPGHEALFCDVVSTGLLPPLAAPVRRFTFPKGSPLAGETHRLAEGSLTLGSGMTEAIAAGAEQVILVAGAPEEGTLLARRRGFWSVLEGMLATLERQSLERELEEVERLNRVIETVGHDDGAGRRAWQDPATGHLHRAVELCVIRPQRRTLGLLQFSGVRDRVTEVVETPADLLDQGYRDTLRQFVEPIFGAAPAPTSSEDSGATQRLVL